VMADRHGNYKIKVLKNSDVVITKVTMDGNTVYEMEGESGAVTGKLPLEIHIKDRKTIVDFRGDK